MNLLVTGAFEWRDEELNELSGLGHHVVFMQYEKDSLTCESEWVEGIIGNGIFLTHPIEQFTSLRYIQLTSAGFDRVPMSYVKEHGISIFNARGVYSVPMAEFVLCGVLDIYKQSRFFFENQRAHKWEKHRGLCELLAKTVLIVGCGSVGNECAKRFGAFGCRVVGVDIAPYKNELYDTMCSIDRLDEVLGQADVVVLTLPLTLKTRNLINADRLACMKKGAVLVNIARGAIVDTDALIAALRGHLGGAVLDVFESEPLDEDNELWNMGNVILTPHNSFVGEANRERLWRVILNNLENIGE